MTSDADNLRALSAFADLANEYCRFIDSLRDGRPESFYTQLESLLPRIQRGIVPVQKKMAQEEHPDFAELAMSHEQWLELANLIQGAVGEQTVALFDWHTQRSEDTDPGVAALRDADASRAEMLWDDLADIYRELLNGLALWNLATPDSRAEAAWDWRFDYEIHWGEHLFRAMMTVHEIRYQLYEY